MSSAARRVLIVVGHYSPTMIADMHRARLLAQDLPALGWDVEVLVPERTGERDDAIEPDAADFFAAATPVHEARGASALFGLADG